MQWISIAIATNLLCYPTGYTKINKQNGSETCKFINGDFVKLSWNTISKKEEKYAIGRKTEAAETI